MAQIRITGSPEFPEGVEAFAYLKRLWPGLPPQPGDAPRGTVISSAVVDSKGEALIEDLDDGESYYVGALVGSTWKWKTASTPAVQISSGSTSGGGVTTAAVDAILLARGVVKSVVKDLGSVSGSVTPDLLLGNIFPMSLSGDATIQKPVNASLNTASDFCELKITTNGHKVAFGAGISVVGEAIYGMDGTVAKLRLGLVSDNDGTTFEALSMDALPTAYVPFSSTPADGQLGAYNASTKVLDPISPSAVGLNDAAVKAVADARIAALSILTGAHPMAYGNAPGGAGFVAVTDSSSAASYVTFLSAILEHGGMVALNVSAVLTGNTTLVEDTFYRVNKAASKQTLPATALVHGRTVVVRNESGGTIKVKGKLNPAVPAEVTEPDVADGETILYLATGGGPEENVWITIPLGRTLAQLEAALAPGAWASIASLPAGVIPGTGGLVAAARLEQSAANVRLRGVLETEAAKPVALNARICTLPVGKRPAAGEEVMVAARVGTASQVFSIDEAGVMKTRTAEIPASTKIWLDSITFSIT